MTANSMLPAPTTLRDKLAQLLFVRIGSNLPPVRKVEEDAERIEELLTQCSLGGLLLFNGTREGTPDTLARLQEKSQFPLLVASDIERGVGQQMYGYSLFPHAMSFAALESDAEAAVEKFAQLKAKMARAAGIHVSLSPVADVNVDPRNPIIATRAFGSDPVEVSKLVAAYVKGCQGMGLHATAKHYPGHGNTHEDSHHELPTVQASRDELETCEFEPFRAAVTAGVSLVMTAHVRYPALDDSGKCATLSKPILTDLLRRQMGFEGIVMSDSLLMEGVKSQCEGQGELVVEALNAGVDIMLDVEDPGSAIDSLERAVLEGRISEQRVEEAWQRVWKLKQQVFEVTNEDSLDQSTVEEADRFAKHVASASIQILSEDAKSLPFSKEKNLCAFLLRSHTSRIDPPEQPLAAALRKEFSECSYYELGPDVTAEQLAQYIQIAASAEQVLVAFIVKPAAWHRFGLLDDQVDFVQQVSKIESCVIASLGTPEALEQYSGNATKLCTYSDVPVSQEALAKYVTKKP